jgi:hypothetical protein
MARISPVLQQYLQAAKPGDLVEIVLEIHEQPSPEALPAERRERSAALEQQFTSSAESVIQGIQNVGGTVLGSSWLGSAIKARVPVEHVNTLLSLDRVEAIDLPRKITRS